jgi:hypothetical protein
VLALYSAYLESHLMAGESLETLEPMGGGLVTDTTRTRTRLNDAGSNSIDETNSSDTNSLGTTATRTSTRTRSTGIHEDTGNATPQIETADPSSPTRTGRPNSQHEHEYIQTVHVILPQRASWTWTTRNTPFIFTFTFIFILIRNACTFWFNFFMRTFTNNMPTSQLHAVTIVLLCVHFFVMKLQQELPNVIIRMLQWAEERGQSTDSTWPWLTSEIEALDKLFFEIILDGLGQSQSQGRSASGIAGTPARYRDMLMDNETAMLKMPSFTETQQLTSLILPLTVLSLFLLMTMTMFLIFHMTFQGILYISSLSLSSVSSDSDSNNGNGNGNGNWSLSNSPLTMAIIMLLLLLENVLPWIFFGTGLYFAFSM